MKRTLASLTLLCGACSMTPQYHVPPTGLAPAAAFKEVAGWSPAQPSDGKPRGPWWTLFADSRLTTLIEQAHDNSPTLAAALARYDQALASVRGNRAQLLPSLGLTGEGTRQRVSGNRPLASNGAQTYGTMQVNADLFYEPDLWGRIRANVTAARGDADAADADLHSARLAIDAYVADAYVRLRGLDAQTMLLERSAAAFERALELTQTRHEGGIVSQIDVSRAQTVLHDALAQLADVGADRAATEHELAALVGQLPSDLTIARDGSLPAAPEIEHGIPAHLLERRPDIAAAERRLFAANQRIGAARASLFPSVTLGAQGGVLASRGELLSVPSTFWAIGPLSLNLPLFDGGRRKADIAISRAQYEELAADYRLTVLNAFREVEDLLAARRYLVKQVHQQSSAAASSRRTAEIAMDRYREGASDYLAVVSAQTDALSSARQSIIARIEQSRTAIALIRAIGGTPEDKPKDAKGAKTFTVNAPALR